MQYSEPRLVVFSDPLFFLFFAIVFGVHWALPHNRTRKTWLLVCSYCFYGAWDYRFLSLILISTAVDYVAGLAIHRSQSKRVRQAWLILSLTVNLGILGFFKYFNFFVEPAVSFLAWLGLPASQLTLQIILPVGISFYTFQTMSYTIDIYLSKLKPARNLLDFALFVAFFPQLVAGPIVRAREFLPQLDLQRRLGSVNFRFYLVLFLIGYVKKACISDRIAEFIDPIFAQPEGFSASAIWGCLMFYAVQIYCDFSGYSDIAIACGGLLGFRLPENFRFPYFAPNISEFWHRWHMSLSTWLRDYLYIPLGGNRGPPWFVYRNIMVTMLLGGLWHGASWKFVIWGGLHGFALIAHRLWRKWEKPPRVSLAIAFSGTFLTFGWVCLTWIFFRAPNWQVATTMCMCLLGGSPGDLLLHPVAWLTLIGLALTHWGMSRWSLLDRLHYIPKWLFFLLLGACCAAAVSLAMVDTEPFIYFQF